MNSVTHVPGLFCYRCPRLHPLQFACALVLYLINPMHGFLWGRQTKVGKTLITGPNRCPAATHRHDTKRTRPY
jgi:hypothetical protein